MHIVDFLNARLDEIDAATRSQDWKSNSEAGDWKFKPEAARSLVAVWKRLIAKLESTLSPAELVDDLKYMAHVFSDHPDYDPEWNVD